ncbi:hypothetical protein C6502_08780 [Candidatus Poribacteria bacterium]|nr:MAG: hypothetical protein C6502_08780 [Candidatus Poribacteria bacterium]
MTINATKPLLLSLKPCYADLVFEGLKKAELRRRIAPHITDRDVFIYVSSPIMAIHGGFQVGKVWHGTPEEVWRMVSRLVGVNKPDFDTYFEGQTVAYALEIKEVWECSQPISLGTLRNKFSNFAVPQSWRYVRTDEHQFFRKMKPQTETCLEQHQRLSQPLAPRYAHM